MKSFILVCLLAAGLPMGALAEEPPKTITGSVSTTVLPNYLLSNGFVAHENAVLQTDLFISFPKTGLWVDIWNSNAFDGNASFGDEMDYVLAWSGQVAKFNVTVGIAYFDLFKVGDLKGDIIDPRIQIGRTFVINDKNSIAIYSKLEFAIPTPGTKFEGGIYAHVGLLHSFNPTKRFHLTQEFVITEDTGVAHFEDTLLAKYRGEATLDLTETISAFANCTVMTPFKSLHDRHLSASPGFGMRVKF